MSTEGTLVLFVTQARTALVEPPSAAAITTSMRKILGPGGHDPFGGSFVGPAPRITRTTGLVEVTTNVAWLYQWPPTHDLQVARVVRDQRENLDAWLESDFPITLGMIPIPGHSEFDPVRAVTFNPAVNGTLAQWQSGEMAHTATGAAAPTGADILTQPAENPIGPGTTSTSTQDVVSSLGGIFDSLKWVVIIGGAAYVASKVVK